MLEMKPKTIISIYLRHLYCKKININIKNVKKSFVNTFTDIEHKYKVTEMLSCFAMMDLYIIAIFFGRNQLKSI